MNNSIVINDVSEISIEKLMEMKNLEYIIINVYIGSKEKPVRSAVYTKKEDLIECKKEIDKIVNLAKKNANSEIQLFANIYKILSDYCQTSYEESLELRNVSVKNNDIETFIKISGLSGLLLNKCFVCFDIAFTLFNICKCAGLDCVMINGKSIDNNNDNHSWNVVKLDNDWYCCDLMWDLKNLKKMSFPLREFLKSSDDFEHKNLFDYYSKDAEIELCKKTFPIEKQETLFRNANINKSKISHINIFNFMKLFKNGDINESKRIK